MDLKGRVDGSVWTGGSSTARRRHRVKTRLTSTGMGRMERKMISTSRIIPIRLRLKLRIGKSSSSAATVMEIRRRRRRGAGIALLDHFGDHAALRFLKNGKHLADDGAVLGIADDAIPVVLLGLFQYEIHIPRMATSAGCLLFRPGRSASTPSAATSSCRWRTGHSGAFRVRRIPTGWRKRWTFPGRKGNNNARNGGGGDNWSRRHFSQIDIFITEQTKKKI